MKTEIYIHTCTCAARRNGDLAYISVFPFSFEGHACPTVQCAPQHQSISSGSVVRVPASPVPPLVYSTAVVDLS